MDKKQLGTRHGSRHHKSCNAGAPYSYCDEMHADANMETDEDDGTQGYEYQHLMNSVHSNQVYAAGAAPRI
eukprot:411518-Prorocentrum_lima.AAC.1